MKPPVVEANGYVTTFVRRIARGRPRWVHACWLKEPGPWPVIEGGWFLWQWEYAHRWYLGIGAADWQRMPRVERMRAELQLQAMFWIPDTYAPNAARQLDPAAYGAWNDSLDWNTVCARSDPDTFLDRPYGPGPEMRHEGAHWRSVLRARGWPIPDYAPPPPMPVSLGDARLLEMHEVASLRLDGGAVRIEENP